MMRRFKNIALAVALATTLCALSGCFVIAPLLGMKGGYSFTGASIPAGATTFSVAYMTNNTSEFPTLSNVLTEELRNRFVRQTKLTQVPEGGDLAFEGEIVSALEAPAAIGAAGGDNRIEGAVLNRMTINVTVQFTNEIDPKLSFENRRTFSAYTDYEVGKRPGIDDALVTDLVEKLVDEIFNAAVAQWN